jgi:hypothetical protein
LVVQRQPSVEERVGRRPDDARVVGIPRAEQPARRQHAPHFPQGAHRIGKVLEYLSHVDEIETAVIEGKWIRVAGLENHVVDALLHAPFLGEAQHPGRPIDTGHASRRDMRRQIQVDGPGPAPHVEQPLSGSEFAQQTGGGIRGAAPRVAAQNRFVVTVDGGVRHEATMTSQVAAFRHAQDKTAAPKSRRSLARKPACCFLPEATPRW